MHPIFIGHEIYRQSSHGGRPPLRVPRVSTVKDLTRALGWLPDAPFRRSPGALPQALTHWHSPACIAALQEAEATGPAPHLRAFGLAPRRTRYSPTSGAGLRHRRAACCWRRTSCAMAGWSMCRRGGDTSRAARPRQRVLPSERSGAGDAGLAPGRGAAHRLCRYRRGSLRRGEPGSPRRPLPRAADDRCPP